MPWSYTSKEILSVREILLRQPKPQGVLHLRGHLYKADADISALVDPGYFYLGLDVVVRSGQGEGYQRRFAWIEAVFHANLESTLAQIDELCAHPLLTPAAQSYRHLHSGPVIAQAPIKNHVARSGERAHRLLYGNWLIEGEHGATFLHVAHSLRGAHNHQGDSVCAGSFFLQLAKKLPRAIQVAVDNQSIALWVGEPGKS